MNKARASAALGLGAVLAGSIVAMLAGKAQGPHARTPTPVVDAEPGASLDEGADSSRRASAPRPPGRRCGGAAQAKLGGQFTYPPAPSLPATAAIDRMEKTLPGAVLADAVARCESYMAEVNRAIARNGWPEGKAYHPIRQQFARCGNAVQLWGRAALAAGPLDQAQQRYVELGKQFVAGRWTEVRAGLAQPGASLRLPPGTSAPGKQKNVLHLAIQTGAPADIVELALDQGIVPDGFLLPMALEKGREDIFASLLPHSQGLNAMQFDGAPSWAVYVSARDRGDLMQRLSDHGADFSMRYSAFGRFGSALDHYLLSHSGPSDPPSPAMVELFLAKGASVAPGTLSQRLPDEIRSIVARACVQAPDEE